MISFTCLDDCRAEIVVLEANRPVKCWNCGRDWSFVKGTPTPSRPTVTVFPRLEPVRTGEEPDKTDEVTDSVVKR